MASIINDETGFHDRRFAERRHYPGAAGGSWTGNAFRVSWAGIWAGVLAALGTLLLLSALGFAIGVSAMDFRSPDVGALGTGTAIWLALSLLIAMFVGGLVATRLGMVTDRSTGFYEGALVWVLATLVVLYLAGSGVGSLLGGAFNLAGGAGRGIASMVGTTDLSPQNIDQIVNRLQNPETAQQIATATGLPVAEVSERLGQTAQAVQAARDNPAQAAAEVRQSISDLMSRAQPMERLEQAGQTSAWVSFFALLLSLAAAVAGAAVGRRRASAHRPLPPPTETAPAA